MNQPVATYSTPEMDEGLGVLHFSIYILEGLIIVPSMLLIILTILRHEALRRLKEYWVILGLCSADGLNGMAALAAGIYRISLILADIDTELVSRRSCFLTVHNLIWLVAFPLQGITLCIVSIDRFLAVYIPFRYLKLTRRYAMWMLAAAYAFCSGLLFAGGISVLVEEAQAEALCLTAYSVSEEVYRVMYAVQLTATFLSIAIYALVLMVYSAHNNRVAQSTGSQRSNQNSKKQKTLTINLAISSGFTFLFFGIPNLAIWTCHLLDYDGFDFLNVWAYILNNINPMMNLWIMLVRQPDVRYGMKALFANKTLPPELSLWMRRKTTVRNLKLPEANLEEVPPEQELHVDTVP